MATFAHLLLTLFIGLFFLSTPTLSRKMHLKNTPTSVLLPNYEENTVSPSPKKLSDVIIIFPHPPAPAPKRQEPASVPINPLIWSDIIVSPPTQEPTADALARSSELS
uniref:Hydroxyproline-rich glycoprotein family protein n=1 Tax=Solanum tuberosum TaxID=4113 RepID=M1DJQ6_SOLTU